MAKFELTSGLTEYMNKLKMLDADTASMMKMALYEGAGLCADKAKTKLAAACKGHFKNPKRKDRGWSPGEWEKATGEVVNSMYLAPMKEENGYIYTEIGLAGYVRGYDEDHDTPAALIGNVLEHGTSHVQKRPWCACSIRACQQAAVSIMARKFTELIDKNYSNKND